MMPGISTQVLNTTTTQRGQDMLSFNYNAQDLYVALTEVSKYITKDKTLPVLRDVMITLDHDMPGIWLTATDRFKVLSAYIGELKQWRPLPEQVATHGINPTQYKVITAHLKDLGVSGRKQADVSINVDDNDRLTWSIHTPNGGITEIFGGNPSELSYPRLHQLVNPVVDKETHTVVSLEHFGGAKFLSIRFSDQDRNRPQLIQSIPGKTDVPFIGLVMPIRTP